MAFGAHGVVGGLNAAEGGAFLHHKAEQTCEDGGDGPGGVPRVWMEVCDGQAQPVEAKTGWTCGLHQTILECTLWSSRIILIITLCYT